MEEVDHSGSSGYISDTLRLLSDNCSALHRRKRACLLELKQEQELGEVRKAEGRERGIGRDEERSGRVE
jgi:hypothetical protein